MKPAAQNTIKVTLTKEQTESLQPLIDKLHNDPEPGLILAQVWIFRDMAGISAGYINKEQGIKLQEAMGTERVGQYPSDLELQTVRSRFIGR